MIIIQDFREKKGHHREIEKYCETNGIVIHRMSLDVGDYMLGDYLAGKYFTIGKVSVDTKQDLEELASDLHRDKLEFNKKYRKCTVYIRLFDSPPRSVVRSHSLTVSVLKRTQNMLPPALISDQCPNGKSNKANRPNIKKQRTHKE